MKCWEGGVLVVLALAAVRASALPTARVTGCEQSVPAAPVVVTYEFGAEPAIVTFDIQTNTAPGAAGEWVSIGGRQLRHAVGDVNRLVEGAGEKTFRWYPDVDWPGRLLAAGSIRAVVTACPTNEPPDYFALDIASGERRYYPDVESLPGGIESDDYRMGIMLFRRIRAKDVEWTMGSPSNEKGRGGSADNGPSESARRVILSCDYYLGVFEVTQWQVQIAQYVGYAKYARFKPDGENRYVDCTWKTRPMEDYAMLQRIRSDANGKEKYWATKDEDGNWNSEEYMHSVGSSSFIGKLRARSGLGYLLDLPTEAQWEFACRAGCGAALYDGNELSVTEGSCPNLDRLARYKGNGGYVDGEMAEPACTTEYGTARVGSYAPNAWGLYDMLGNVAEWCLDYYTTSAQDGGTDPIGPVNAGGNNYVIRGGGWMSEPKDCRCAARRGCNCWITPNETGGNSDIRNTGFRMCLTIR